MAGKGRRIILFPLPLQGHINPMIQLATILHTRGFEITVVHTEFNSPNHSNFPHFAFRSISDGLSGTTEDLTCDMHYTTSMITFLNQSCIEPFRDCLDGVLSESEEPVACLITDALWHSTQTVADGFKLPRMVLRTSSLSCFIVYLGLLRHRPSQDTKSHEGSVPELSPLIAKDISRLLIDNQEGTLDQVNRMIRETKASSGLIWNTFVELEQPELASISREFLIPSFTIGPFHKYLPSSLSSLLKQDRDSLAWLDLQPSTSVLYVSFGSLANLDEPEFVEMAWGLANSRQPFLWVVRPGTVRGSKWLEALPKGYLDIVGHRGHIIKWAPQQEVLAHPAIGGFWTHSGWNSTLESICAGVPMICSPFRYDQPINARYITDVWRIGVLLENGSERYVIKRVIERVMVDEEGKEMSKRIKFLKEKAHLCLEKGGSSYQAVENLIDYILSF